MKRLILILICIWPAAAGAVGLHLIIGDHLPKDEMLYQHVRGLVKIEPYAASWTPDWKHDVSRDSVITQLESAYDYVNQLQQTRPLNLELDLLTGLIAQYRYNFDIENSWDIATNSFLKADRLVPKDPRPLWFLANHYVLSSHIEKGVGVYRYLISQFDISQPEFWEDYAYAAQLSRMPFNTIMALDQANRLLKNTTYYEALFGAEVRAAIRTFSRTDRLADTVLWKSIDREDTISFISFPLGVKFTTDSHAKVQLSAFENDRAYVTIKIGPYQGTENELMAAVAVYVRVADDPMRLTEFISEFKDPAYDYKEFDFDLGLDEITYGAINDNFYKKEGAGHSIIIGFERIEPDFPGVRLEEPVPISESDGMHSYQYERESIFRRYQGRLFYLIMFDCADSVFNEAYPNFKEFLKTFVVD